MHVYDTELSVNVPRDDEEYYRSAAKLITDTVNTYSTLFKGKKGDKDIMYMAMLDIALKYKKEGVRNDTAPFNDILGKLTSEIEEVLKKYFANITIDEKHKYEWLRIPHFYNPYYVYKYATGISASLALAERVCNGGESERKDYFTFLTSGGSRYPIESLRIAGVDMASPEPVEAACKHFARLVAELDTALAAF